MSQWYAADGVVKLLEQNNCDCDDGVTARQCPNQSKTDIDVFPCELFSDYF